MIVQKIQLINFKNIGEFRGEFTKGIYLVTGENDKGKSNLIGSIMTCLTGTRSANLLKQGEEKGSVSVEIGDEHSKYTIELRFSDKNPRGTLYIKDENSGMETNNLSVLQKMFQYTDFDANEFVQMSTTAEGRKRQVEIIKKLLPEKVLEQIQGIEQKLPELEADRREWGRKIKDLDGSIKEMAITKDQLDYFTEEINVDELSDRIEKATTHNNMIAQAKERMQEKQNILNTYDNETEFEESKFEEQMIDIEDEILRLKKKQDILKEEKEKYSERRKSEKSKIKEQIADLKAGATQEPENVDSLREQMSQAGDHNRMVLRIQEYNKQRYLLQDAIEKRKELDDKIKEHRAKKESLVKDSKLPIEGLSFEDDQLTINNIPFAPGEVSTSQQIEIAAKLIIAMNPKMKVFKLMNGESLGQEKFNAIIDFAKKEGYQGFIEEMHRGQADLRVEEYTERIMV